MKKVNIIKKDGKIGVVDEINNISIFPDCANDLAAYHAYLLGRGMSEQAKDLLCEVVNGQKPITQMINKTKGERDVR